MRVPTLVADIVLHDVLFLADIMFHGLIVHTEVQATPLALQALELRLGAIVVLETGSLVGRYTAASPK